MANLDVAVVDAIQAALAEVPRNDVAWTYTILGFDKSPYITRTLLPRFGGYRTLIHRIHRDDADPHPHNHPWLEGEFVCVSGGYTDERWELDQVSPSLGVWRSTRRLVRPGDVNRLTSSDFHRAIDVLPETRTVGLVGERVQDWGFLVDGVVVPHADYFAQRGHVDLGGVS